MIRLIVLLVCIVGAAFLFLSHSKKEEPVVSAIKTDTLSTVEQDLPVFKTDDPENFICSQVIDNETHEPQLERTVKCWYTLDKNGEKYAAIECSYEEDGTLELAVDKTSDPDNEQNWAHYDYETFHELQEKFPADISYYKTAALLPKEAYQS
jgi:hypothetical protein